MKKMTEENVKAALAGESQAHVKYAAFAEKAVAEKLPNVARAFKANSYAEQVHATNYVSRDIDFKAIHVCGVCGFTMEGDAPDKCPVCGAPKDKFVTF